jgi:hypothetical protein
MWYQIRSFFSFVGSLLQILLHLRTCNSWGWLCHFGFGFGPHFGLGGSVICGPLRRPDSAARRRTSARNSRLSANAQFKKYARRKGQEIICVLCRFRYCSSTECGAMKMDTVLYLESLINYVNSQSYFDTGMRRISLARQLGPGSVLGAARV